MTSGSSNSSWNRGFEYVPLPLSAVQCSMAAAAREGVSAGKADVNVDAARRASSLSLIRSLSCRARVNLPFPLRARVGQRTGRSGASGVLAEDVDLYLIDRAHGRQRLAAGERQLQRIGVEIDLRVGHHRALVPAVRAAPSREVDMLLRVPLAVGLEPWRHAHIHIAVSLVAGIQEHDGRRAARRK